MLLDNTRKVSKSGGGFKDVPSASKEQSWLNAAFARGMRERFAEVVSITPRLAEMMLQSNTRNRALSATTAKKYAESMSRGEWMLSAQGISFSCNGMLIDGQHRLAAIILAERAVKCTIWFGCAADEFQVLDAGRARSPGDILSIEGMDNYHVRAAVAQIMWRIRNRTQSGAPRLVVAQFARELAGDAMDKAILHANRSKRVLNPTAMVIAIYSILTQSNFAHRIDAFCEGVKTGASLDPKSPILALREFFRTSSALSRNSRDRVVLEASAVVIAWNAFIKGRVVRNFVGSSVVTLPDIL